MAAGGPLPFFALNGVEVANAARTLSYLRRGLGGTKNGHWEFGPGDVCGVLYRLHGGSCAAPDMFVHPAVDPAPWYDASEVGSTSFLGLVLLDLQGYDSTIKRTATTRLGGLGGGTLSAQYRTARVWKFRGALISADDLGAEFGLRWLTAALETGDCDTCSTGTLVVRLACPPADCSDDTIGEWTSYQAALTAGPDVKEPWGPAKLRSDSDVLAGCRDWVTVEFDITAGNPFLYKRPHVCLPAEALVSCTDDPIPIVYPLTAFADSGGRARRRTMTITSAPLAGIAADVGFTARHADVAVSARRGHVRRSPSALTDACENICTFLSGAATAPCCTVNPPLRGILGAIFTLTSTSGYGNVELVSRRNCGDSVSLLQMQISSVPAGGQVVVNCSDHTVTVTDAAGNVTDGQGLLVIQAGATIQWIEVADCEAAACVCVESLDQTPGHDLTVEIETQIREG